MKEVLDGYWLSFTSQYSLPFIYMCTFILHQILFWGVSIPFTVLDINKSPTSLYKYKIQKNIQVEWQEVKKCIKLVVINQLLVMLPFTAICCPIAIYKIGMSIDTPLPEWTTFLWHMVIFVVVEEVLFYYSHRLLHHPVFYTPVHKIHHQFRAPIGMAAEYSHPFEFFISSMVPIVVGPFMLRTHIVTAWVWYSIATVGTIFHHCGYQFPWLFGNLSPAFHDYHHYSFNTNFGLLGWLDKLHGTVGVPKLTHQA